MFLQSYLIRKYKCHITVENISTFRERSSVLLVRMTFQMVQQREVAYTVVLTHSCQVLGVSG